MSAPSLWHPLGCLALILFTGFCAPLYAQRSALPNQPSQEPSCVQVPEPTRSCVDVLIAPPSVSGLGRTGIGSFDADSEPGRDLGPENHVIRTLDGLHYELRYRVLHETAQNLLLRVTLPANLELTEPPNPNFQAAPIPSYCQSGSSLQGGVLDCALGSVAPGTTRNIALRTRPTFAAADGSILRLGVQLSASNQQSTGAVIRTGYQNPLNSTDLSCSETRLGQTITMTPCGDLVSALARFDLEFSGYSSTNLLDRGARGPQLQYRALGSTLTTVVGGAPNRDGFVVAYPIAIALPGEGLGGAPANVAQPIVITERLRNSDGIAGFGELIGCGLNGNEDPVPNGNLLPAGWGVGQQQASALQAIFHPFGKLGFTGSNPDNSVADSGAIACTQTVAGGAITLSLTPTANSFQPVQFPTRQVDGQISPRRYVFVALVSVFYPAAPVLLPQDGGTGDGSVTIRHDVGVLQSGQLQALRINGQAEPDSAAIDDGFFAVDEYDDDNNNFSIATLDSGGTQYSKNWVDPRLGGGFPFEECLLDHSDPSCRHGYTFPGRNLLANFFFNNDAFSARNNAEFCDEWDNGRTLLRMPFDNVASPMILPPGVLATLELQGANASDPVLNNAQFQVEVSTQAGTVANIDWDSVEPARSQSRSQLSAPECSSGTWVPLTLPTTLSNGRFPLLFPSNLEMPAGSGRYPSIRRMRIRTQQLPAFVSLNLRASYEVIAAAPLTRLPNRTSFRYDNASIWTYAENDHAIVRLVDTSIVMNAIRNITTGEAGPLTAIGFGEVYETVIQTQFSSGDPQPSPSSAPLVIKAYLPNSVDYISGSASPSLAALPYPDINPDSGQAATVLEWRLANLIPGQAVTPVSYRAQLNFLAANQSTLHSSSTVEHPLDPGPLFVTPIQSSLEDRLAFNDLQASVPVGLLVNHQALAPFIEVNGNLRWQLRYANTSGAPFSRLRLIDVLPALGDPINTGNAFQGSIGAGQLLNLINGEHSGFYTLSARSQINRDPNCVSNGGSVPDGSGSCPAAGATWVATNGNFPALSTAVRIDDQNGLAANSIQELELRFASSGNRGGDVYENSFTAVAPGESLAVASTRTQVTVPEATARGRVFADLDENQQFNAVDFGIGNVTILLNGVDQHGRQISVRTQTVNALATGVANFISINGSTEQVQSCTPPTRLMRGEFYFCKLPSANSQGYTLSEVQPLEYADRNDILGNLSNGGNAGTVGNDVFTGLRLQNNLLTGAGDRATQYQFAEFPLFANISGRVYVESSLPLNQIDDGEQIDPGLMTHITLSCNPAYQGNAVEPTSSDGRFQFANVPIAANCTLTETQPAGYFNAYNLLGTGGITETGGANSGVINSRIILVVPALGSQGNVFAETKTPALTEVQQVPILSRSLLAWLVLLIFLIGVGHIGYLANQR